MTKNEQIYEKNRPSGNNITPNIQDNTPSGNTIETAHKVARLENGATNDMVPMCKAVIGKVNIPAPTVVAKDAMTKSSKSLITFGLLLTKSRKASVSDKSIFDVNNMIPKTAAKDNCKLTEATEYGFIASSKKSEADNEVKLSFSRLKRGAQMRKMCMIPARVTEGVKPVKAI